MTAWAWASGSRRPSGSPVELRVGRIRLDVVGNPVATLHSNRSGSRICREVLDRGAKLCARASIEGQGPLGPARRGVRSRDRLRHCSLNRSSMRMCDSSSLRRGSSRPLRPNSQAIARRDLVDREDHLQLSRIVDQVLPASPQRAGNRPASRRIAASIRAIHPSCIRARAYAWSTSGSSTSRSSPFQQAPGCP